MERRAWISGIVLAAGASRRFASSARSRPYPKLKQLLLIEGEPLVRRTVRTALGSQLDELFVVVGFKAAEVSEVVRDLPVTLVENLESADGQSTSLRTGLNAVAPQADAVMFLPSDQPLLTTTVIDQLVVAWRSSTCGIVSPMALGQRGAPKIWSREYFEALSSLRGDMGGRALLGRFEADVAVVELENELALADIDTVEDWERLKVHVEASRKGL